MTASIAKALHTGIRLARDAAVVVLLLPIRVYQLAISPYMPMSCRYWPSCSAYAAEAVRRHGPLGGAWLTLRRILRCHPWGGWGYDPVPQSNDKAADACSRGKHRADARTASPSLSMPRPAGLNER